MPTRKIVILTGAGISAESGLSTFRTNNGLWNNNKIEDVATLEAFERNPDMVHHFYNDLRPIMLNAQPNYIHNAISMLQSELKNTEINIITQNIDLLHEKARNKNICHIHGRIDECICMNCGQTIKVYGDISTDNICPHCKITGMLKPNIIFFGEMPQHLKKVEQLLTECHDFIAIGTSGTVYPAAGFVQTAKKNGATTYLFNLDKTDNTDMFDYHFFGNASETFTKFAEKLLIKQDNHIEKSFSD